MVFATFAACRIGLNMKLEQNMGSQSQESPAAVEKKTARVRLAQFWAKMKDLIVDPNESDFTKSLSVAVGVFISIIPLWGLQTLTAIGVAFLFRLNKPLVIASSYLSVPPILGPILFLSMGIGGLFVANPVTISFTNITPDLVAATLWQYGIGSLVLALIAAPIFGIMTYGALKLLVKR